MRKVTLGRDGLQCSIIGLGCKDMSEFYGARDDAQSLHTLQRVSHLRCARNLYGPLRDLFGK